LLGIHEQLDGCDELHAHMASTSKIERNLTVRFLPALKDGASTAFRNSEALR
jgi:hypothetical protein